MDSIKKGCFYGNNSKIVGIILRIIGEFKRIARKNNWKLKSIIDFPTYVYCRLQTSKQITIKASLPTRVII